MTRIAGTGPATGGPYSASVRIGTHFTEFNAAYEVFFTEPHPARTTIYCGLRADVLVEVSALAVLSA